MLTLAEMIVQAYVNFLGQIAATLVTKLDTHHQCAQVRLGEDGHGSWGQGVLYDAKGACNVRVWQQSPYAGAGNLSLWMERAADKIVFTASYDNAFWIEQSFTHEVTADHIAGWIVDAYDARYCKERGVLPLPENKHTAYEV